MPNDPEPLLLRVSEVAAALGVGKDRVYELIASNQLPVVRLGERSVRVPRHLLVEWIVSRTEAATPIR